MRTFMAQWKKYIEFLGKSRALKDILLRHEGVFRYFSEVTTSCLLLLTTAEHWSQNPVISESVA